MQKAILGRLVPALRAFGPDLILISAGFDAGKGDLGNYRDSHGGMDLQADDFSWITSQILAVSRICCPGRVVSVLEGGYGRSKWVPDAVSTTDEEIVGTQNVTGAELAAPPTQHVSHQGGSKGHYVLNRDILVANSSAHLRALVDGGGSMNV
jgi:acetoin utilization deacetylase AcuC-like enzyme